MGVIQLLIIRFHFEVFRDLHNYELLHNLLRSLATSGTCYMRYYYADFLLIPYAEKVSDFQAGNSHSSQKVSKMIPSSPFPSYQKAGYTKVRQYYHLENMESRDLDVFARVLHV